VELVRLDQQGAFLRPATRALFVRAGIAPGMRVLDFGSGAGDVALLAADMVGGRGEVVGFDRSAQSVKLATSRAAALGLRNVRFVQGDEGDVAGMAAGRPFDALVGRLVLMHQEDVAGSLAALARFVRPAGLLAFHEIDVEAGYWSSRPDPFLEQLWRWVNGMADRGIFRRNIARELHDAFDLLGVVDRQIVREGRVVRAGDPAAGAWIAALARTLIQPVHELRIARETDVPMDVLLQRARVEAGDALIVPAHLVGATGRLPLNLG
jgi:SAM-dependent methyltransferase